MQRQTEWYLIYVKVDNIPKKLFSLIHNHYCNQVTVLGEKEAAVRGFCQWTSEKDMILKRRIHLIEVTDPRLVNN
jgi:hypothetical protein